MMDLTVSENYDPLRDDPFLPPSWRFQRVLEMISKDPVGRPTKHDDEFIKECRAFMMRWRKGDNERFKLKHEKPGMYTAFCIWDRVDTDPEFQFMIEARLLANQSYRYIANAMKMSPAAAQWYDRIFFNVTPFLTNMDWVLKHVLLPASDRFAEEEEKDGPTVFKTPIVVRPHLDMTLKYFSYYGGPIMCDYMIAGFRLGTKCNSQDDIGEWIDEAFGLMARRRSLQAGQEFDINKYNVMELFATHLRIMEISRSSDAQEDKHSTIEKHIHGMMGAIPWTVGKDAREVFQGTAIGEADEMAAELNAEELMLIGAGQKLPVMDELPDLTIHTRENLEGKDANAKPK